MPEPQLQTDDLTVAEKAFIRALFTIWPNMMGYKITDDVQPGMGRLVNARIVRRRVNHSVGAVIYDLHPEYIEHWGATPAPWLN